MSLQPGLQVVGRVHSPYREKFGIPRQPGLVPAARGSIEMQAPFDDPRMLDGLEGFSHAWIISGFHATERQGWRPRVRPPRLGGNREVGVFASRSPFRPNHLGLSVVHLLAVCPGGRAVLQVAGLDLLDGTPVYDIKPYLPYVDAIAEARGGFAAEAPKAAGRVEIAAAARAQLARHPEGEWLTELIVQTLGLETRPAYRVGPEPERVYGTRMHDVNVRWQVLEDRVRLLEVEHLAGPGGTA